MSDRLFVKTKKSNGRLNTVQVNDLQTVKQGTEVHPMLGIEHQFGTLTKQPGCEEESQIVELDTQNMLSSSNRNAQKQARSQWQAIEEESALPIERHGEQQ